MDSAPPSSLLPAGHRTLAAIVFTDVVSFSARVQADENNTLALLQRDFALMRETCTKNGGAVLKTLGDGLLMHFSSAVAAVVCALEMQNHFAATSHDKPAKECLTHRVGIHLGDVFVTEQDVMGDGVNIASRLQSVAEPGGICISQTVYDVVKNKLALNVTSLGPRELKNIAEAMPVYRLLLEAQSAVASGTVPAAQRPAHSRLVRPGVLIAGAIVLVLGAGVFWWVMRSHEDPLSPSATTATAMNTAGDDDIGADLVARAELIQQTRAQYLKTYDFDGLARFMHEKLDDASGKSKAPVLMRGVEQMATMRQWLASALRRYSRVRPLQVADFSGDVSKAFATYISPDRKMHLVRAGVEDVVEFTDVEPPVMGAILVSALHDVQPAPGPQVVGGAHAFASMYNLPAMREALGKRGRGGNR